MATKLESLIVDLQLNTAELKKGVDSAVSTLGGIQGMLKGIAASAAFKVLADSAMAAAQAVGDLVVRGAELLDQTGKQAAAAGVSAEKYSQLAYAFRINDVSAEDFSKSIAHLGKELVAASQGSAKQEALFRALGVQVKDASGAMRTADAVLMDLSAQFAQMPPSLAKSQLAVELFGKGTENMAIALSAGTEGLTALMAEADMFGLTVSGRAAEAADEFNDNLSRLKELASGVAQEVAANVLPALNQLLERLLSSDSVFQAIDLTVTVLSTSIKVLVAVVDGLATAFLGVVTAVEKAAKAMQSMRASAAAALSSVAGMLPGSIARDALQGAAGFISPGSPGGSGEGAAGAGAAGPRHGGGGGSHTPVAALRKASDEAAKALAAAANAEKARAAAAKQAADIKKAADESDAAMRTQLADATRDAAEGQRLQAEAVKQSNDQLKKLAHDTAAASRELLVGAIQNIVSKLGDIGVVIQSAMQGFQSGGVYGAIIAVIVELVARMESFTKLVDAANSSLYEVIGILSEALAPLFRIIQGNTLSMFRVVGSVLEGLGSVLGAVFGPLEKLIPAISLGVNVFEPLADAFGALLEGIGNFLLPVITFVADSIIIVASRIKQGFFEALIWVQTIIRDILDFFGLDSSAVRADIDTNRAIANAAKEASEKAQAEIASMFDGTWSPFATTMEDATLPVEVLGEAAGDAARTLNEFSASLTNVPQGFRYAAAAFNAQDAAGGPGAFGITPLAPVTVIVQGSVIAESDLLAMIEAAQNRDGFRKKGI